MIRPKEKIAVYLETDFLNQIDAYKLSNHYRTRNEAINHLLRRGLQREEQLDSYEARLSRLEAKLAKDEVAYTRSLSEQGSWVV